MKQKKCLIVGVHSNGDFYDAFRKGGGWVFRGNPSFFDDIEIMSMKKAREVIEVEEYDLSFVKIMELDEVKREMIRYALG